MKAFASAIILALAASADEGAHGHYQLNDNYDNSDPGHHHYGSESPASPAYP